MSNRLCQCGHSIIDHDWREVPTYGVCQHLRCDCFRFTEKASTANEPKLTLEKELEFALQYHKLDVKMSSEKSITGFCACGWTRRVGRGHDGMQSLAIIEREHSYHLSFAREHK